MTRPDQTRHPIARAYIRDAKAGKLDRRAFLARVTALGVTVPAAYGMLGLVAPARAQDEPVPQKGGTMRIQMDVRPLKDPRAFDWPYLSYVTAGWLEYLVEYNNDGTFQPMLLDSWDVNASATIYTLRVRPGVTWNDGTPFTAADVARNIAGWCDTKVPGNSMAARFAALIDPATGQAYEGAIRLVDDLTVQLTLPMPDITLIAGMSDYPAAITPAGFDPETMLDNPLGTGPYLPEIFTPGSRAVLVRNDAHDWWGYTAGKGAYLDRIEYIDYGTDPAVGLAAARADEIDATYETVGDFVDLFTTIGWEESAVASSSTIVIRGNQLAEVDGIRPYADKRVRQAIVMAVDNAICLELGYSDRGEVARNQHVGPMHPAWADIPALPHDPAAALALLQEAGMADFEMELLSIDDDWRKNTADAVAAQLRDAGFLVRRQSVPGTTYAANWTTYPFSATDWNHRPLDTQTLALAYRSGAAWNESGFANDAFDDLLAKANGIANADARRPVMAELQRIMVEEAVIVQPYWRTIYRHARPGFVGWDVNIAYLPQIYKFGLARG
ncbi:ABC transporter substrate-binding protein [Yoonia sp.]|uniref:ABC transporter substrate-binding protein n=1 Tax=Yoonia sp. TaxID=2212373 RepID=UPI00391CE8C1